MDKLKIGIATFKRQCEFCFDDRRQRTKLVNGLPCCLFCIGAAKLLQRYAKGEIKKSCIARHYTGAVPKMKRINNRLKVIDPKDLPFNIAYKEAWREKEDGYL